MKALLLRADEADMLCDPAIRDWLAEQSFALTTYDQLAGMGQQTQ